MGCTLIYYIKLQYICVNYSLIPLSIILCYFIFFLLYSFKFNNDNTTTPYQKDILQYRYYFEYR